MFRYNVKIEQYTVITIGHVTLPYLECVIAQMRYDLPFVSLNEFPAPLVSQFPLAKILVFGERY